MEERKDSLAFDTSKMEALIFGNLMLENIYNKIIAQHPDTHWGYHRQENIYNFIFVEFVLNSPKYLEKYKMIKPIEKKRRDASGINQIKKEYEERSEKATEKSQEMKASEEAKTKEPETNNIPNEEEITETTGSGSSGQYSTAFAWSKDGKTHQKPMIPGSTVINLNEDKNNYLVDPAGFKKYFESLNEQPIEIDNAQKKNFITKHSDAYGNELNNMDNEDINIIYKDINDRKLDEKDLKSDINMDKIDEKAVSQKQQQFMGIVRGIQKGDIKPSDASSSAVKAAKEMKKSDVKDFASTSHEGLPEKVSEDYGDTQEFLLKSAMKKLSLNDLLNWSKENVNSEGDLKFKLENLAKLKGIKLEDLNELVDYYLFNNLGFDGIIQTNEQKLLNDVVEELNSILTPEEKELEMANADESLKIDEDSMIDPKEETMAMSGNNPTSMRMKDSNSQNMETGMNDTSSGSGIGESINESKKINQKDYKFYLFNKKTKKIDTGWEFKEDANDAKAEKDNNDYVVYTKQTLNTMGLNPDENKSWLNESDDKILLDSLNEELIEFKNLMDNLSNLGEDRKPSALVLLDRLKNSNDKNFNTDLGKSGTGEMVKIENALQTKKDTTVVGDKPYENGEKIEKDVLDKTKGEAFKNVGDSTNEKGDEIPKRNLTDEEKDDVNLLKLNLADYDFAVKPNDAYEKRMKEQMGDYWYDLRQKKLEARRNMQMFNKNTQPVENVKESFVSAKYRDAFGKMKIIDFNINNIKEIDKIDENYAKLSFEGLGNKFVGNLEDNHYSLKLNEAVVTKLTTNEYYINENNEIFSIKKANMLNESEIKKENSNDFNKMKHLLNYKSDTYLDTKNSKNNRGF